jgi:hypothetical protein
MLKIRCGGLRLRKVNITQHLFKEGNFPLLYKESLSRSFFAGGLGGGISEEQSYFTFPLNPSLTLPLVRGGNILLVPMLKIRCGGLRLRNEN